MLIDTKKEERRPLRVLLVAPDLPIIGGQTVQARRLLDNFARERGVRVDLQPINPRFFPRLQKIKYVRTLLTQSKYIFDLLARVPRYDVIHVFSASYYSFLLAPTPAVLIGKLFGKRTILNYRSGEAADHLEKWRRTAIPTIRLFDRIVMPSGYLVDVFADFGLEASPIFNFVNTDRFRFRARDPLRPVFLSNRNFEAHYNVACTLRAFALVRAERPDARLIVVGDGPERENLHRLAAELKLENVEFTGPLKPDEMPAVYDRADVYLNSPDIDNMPNSIIEAYACGLPVVTTNAGGIPYIVEHGQTGLLVERNDHRALAAGALRLLEDNDFAQDLIARARRECGKYSWDNVRTEWLELYRSLAEKNGNSNVKQAQKT